MQDAVAFEHDVVDAALREAVADGEAGLAAADDDHLVVAGQAVRGGEADARGRAAHPGDFDEAGSRGAFDRLDLGRGGGAGHPEHLDDALARGGEAVTRAAQQLVVRVAAALGQEALDGGRRGLAALLGPVRPAEGEIDGGHV